MISRMTTSTMLGVFRTDLALRMEFWIISLKRGNLALLIQNQVFHDFAWLPGYNLLASSVSLIPVIGVLKSGQISATGRMMCTCAHSVGSNNLLIEQNNINIHCSVVHFYLQCEFDTAWFQCV
jgi:hypothetical protein